MSAKSQIIGAGINVYLNSRPAKYALHTVGRVLRGGRRHARLYYRADDPYSHLLVQAARRLTSEYGLGIEIVPVAHPSTAANPAPDMLLHHAVRDASILAESYGLSFPLNAVPPSEDRTRRAHAVLLERRSADEQLQIAAELGGGGLGLTTVRRLPRSSSGTGACQARRSGPRSKPTTLPSSVPGTTNRGCSTTEASGIGASTAFTTSRKGSDEKGSKAVSI